MDQPNEGPWLFTDPMGRAWVLSIMPLQHGHTRSGGDQLKALICSCDDGWLFAIPVGAEFDPAHQTNEEVARLLVVPQGHAGREPDWDPYPSTVRVVREPASGRVFQVHVVTRELLGLAALRSDAPRTQALLVQECGGAWNSSIPLPPGKTLESLSREDLLRFLPSASASGGRASDSGGAVR